MSNTTSFHNNSLLFDVLGSVTSSTQEVSPYMRHNIMTWNILGNKGGSVPKDNVDVLKYINNDGDVFYPEKFYPEKFYTQLLVLFTMDRILNNCLGLLRHTVQKLKLCNL